jgi:hypothetical protein
LNLLFNDRISAAKRQAQLKVSLTIKNRAQWVGSKCFVNWHFGLVDTISEKSDPTFTGTMLDHDSRLPVSVS